jgi:hypothetical protein
MEIWNLLDRKKTPVGQGICGSLKLQQNYFKRSVNSQLAQGSTLSNIVPRFFLNMDQTTIYFKSISNYTAAKRRAKKNQPKQLK